MDAVAELFREGLSLREVSRRTGICLSTVRARLARVGLHQIRHKFLRNGLAICKRCGREGGESDFPALPHGKYVCRDCLVELNQAVQSRRQGCSPEDYETLLARQNGRCAICGKPEGHQSHRGRKCRLAIDHDHRTGEIRGLLCNNCNRGLGRFKDSVELLEAAVRYLKREQ